MLDENKIIDNQDDSAIQPETGAAVGDEKMQKCVAELKKVKDAFVNLAADFDNYKKRMDRDNSRLYFNAQSDIILKFLPVIDDFQRAFEKGLENQTPEVKIWLDGFKAVNDGFKKLFNNLDVKEIPMDNFDPELHEAVAHVDVEGKASGEIVDYVDKGYTFKGSLIRPAKVAVAK